MAQLPYTVLAYKDSAVARGTTYVYSVAGVNRVGEGARSATKLVKTGQSFRAFDRGPESA